MNLAHVLAVLGDYYHPSEWSKKSLEQVTGLVKNSEIEYCSHEQLKEKLSKQPDAVVLFKENRLNPTADKCEQWMTEEVATEISTYVANGGGWLAWHSGLASFPVESPYIKMLKGSFLYHPEKQQIVHYRNQIQNAIAPNPVAFQLVDEHYFVECDEKNTNIFLTSESVDGMSVAGWSHSFGEGRVCCLTPAHNKEGLLNQDFVSILANCLNWLITNVAS